jgi:hypothetical protein
MVMLANTQVDCADIRRSARRRRSSSPRRSRCSPANAQGGHPVPVPGQTKDLVSTYVVDEDLPGEERHDPERRRERAASA